MAGFSGPRDSTGYGNPDAVLRAAGLAKEFCIADGGAGQPSRSTGMAGMVGAAGGFRISQSGRGAPPAPAGRFTRLVIVLPFWTSLLLLVVLQIGTAVPSSPGRIGVFQYLVILALSILFVDKGVALGYSIILYLVTYIPIALIGSYCFWREKITWKKLAEAAAMLNRLGNRAK